MPSANLSGAVPENANRRSRRADTDFARDRKRQPDYQLGWNDRKAAKASLQRILDWDFERIIIAHGDNIDSNAKAVARRAWKRPLSWPGQPPRPNGPPGA
ncbi:hypothetical protein [Thalassovita aquimarina]|uniref:Zn-dependent metallo-hydrolase RNA specificity domain-containing protein n=1 Tax=Thalassovita aquimarina TaxID=2785917 RepID=A0ABS5HUC7_9RHOB|nr:hypothetical protein [Thalassovita aquimarina]MBR9652572.1 hypothetical protein [Thalassovita aquimarina]